MLQQTFNEKNRDLIVNINGGWSTATRPGSARSTRPCRAAMPSGRGCGSTTAGSSSCASTSTGSAARPWRWPSREIPTHEAITEEIRRTLAANRMRDGVHIRLTLTRGVKITSGMDPRLNQAGPTLIVLAEHKPPVYDKGGITLITSSVRRPSPDCLDPKIHHCNLIPSILAKIQANAAGADDALMLDLRGFVAETNATHVFLVERGRGA